MIWTVSDAWSPLTQPLAFHQAHVCGVSHSFQLVISDMSLVSPLPFFEHFTSDCLAAAYTNLRGFGVVAARADPETLAVPAALPFSP